MLIYAAFNCAFDPAFLSRIGKFLANFYFIQISRKNWTQKLYKMDRKQNKWWLHSDLVDARTIIYKPAQCCFETLKFEAHNQNESTHSQIPMHRCFMMHARCLLLTNGKRHRKNYRRYALLVSFSSLPPLEFGWHTYIFAPYSLQTMSCVFVLYFWTTVYFFAMLDIFIFHICVHWLLSLEYCLHVLVSLNYFLGRIFTVLQRMFMEIGCKVIISHWTAHNLPKWKWKELNHRFVFAFVSASYLNVK